MKPKSRLVPWFAGLAIVLLVACTCAVLEQWFLAIIEVERTGGDVVELERLTVKLPAPDAPMTFQLAVADLLHGGDRSLPPRVQPGQAAFASEGGAEPLLRVVYRSTTEAGEGAGWYFINASPEAKVRLDYVRSSVELASVCGLDDAGQRAYRRRLASLEQQDRRSFDSRRFPLGQGNRIALSGRNETVQIHIAKLDNDHLEITVESGGRATAYTIERPKGFLDVARSRITKVDGVDRRFPSCHGGGFLQTFRAGIDAVNATLRQRSITKRELPIIALGGALTCNGVGEASRIAIPELWSNTLLLHERWLEGRDRNRNRLVMIGAGASPVGEAQRSARLAIADLRSSLYRVTSNAWPFVGRDGGNAAWRLAEVRIDRTTYAVTSDGNELTLCAVDGPAWYSRDRLPRVTGDYKREHRDVSRAQPELVDMPPALLRLVQQHWLRLLAAALGVVTLAMALGIWSKTDKSGLAARELLARTLRVAMAALVAAAAMLVYSLDNDDYAAVGYRTVMVLVIGLWAVATLGVWLTTWHNRLVGGLVWLLVTSMAGLGNVVIAQLGFGSHAQYLSLSFQRSLAPLAIFAAGIVVFSLIPRITWEQIVASAAMGPVRKPFGSELQQSRGVRFLAASGSVLVAIAMLLVWILFGTDEGVTGVIQPSEYIKFAGLQLAAVLVVTTYRGTVVDPSWFSYSQRLLIATAFIFLCFLGVPFLRHDLSPLLILVSTVIVVLLVASIVGLANIGLLRLAAVRQRVRVAPPELVGLGLISWKDVGKGMPTDTQQRRATWAHARALLHEPWQLLLEVSHNLSRYFFLYLAVLIVASTSLAYWSFAKWDAQERDAKIWIVDWARGEGLTKFFGRLAAMYDQELAAQKEEPTKRRFPDEGDQVQRSRMAIALAPCEPPSFEQGRLLGSGGVWIARRAAEVGALLHVDWLLPQPRCTNPGAALALGVGNPPGVHKIPVLQNDFIGAFVIARFGVVVASMLVVLQSLMVLVGLYLAVTTYRWSSGWEERRARSHLLALMVLGCGVLLGLQWFIAWCNVLGVRLPVMGQPMTFVAYAGSHIVLLGLPAIVVFLLCCRLTGEGTETYVARDEPPAIEWKLFGRTSQAGRV